MISNPVSIIFFLDDKRNPNYPTGDTYIVARTFRQALEIISNENFIFDSWQLDHDLGTDAETEQKLSGLDFLKWVVENKLERWPPHKISVHSANYHGRKNMEAYIKQVEEKLL